MTARPDRSELIEDYEVRSAEQDQLGHRAIAQQIVNLIAQVPTPTNVALYGPWGSGKTGIANLVEAGLAAVDSSGKRCKFVRFDAFKFAETPLRRNFISAVATGLGVKQSKYHTDLYSSVTNTHFTLPKVKIWAAIKTFAVAFISVCVVLIGLAALLASAQKGSWHSNFTQNSRSFLVAGFPFAALLTAIIALATKAFGSEHRTERADSAEQFEKLFRDLVDDIKSDKLVVFVDEIDRCAPGEVVATLDVIRTFLGVNKCVFIVAADQQVLETALSTNVRQATPDDVMNPYYSSGSAYLDKVFQYQIAVPPLPNQSVTRYAVELVENRAGVWNSPQRETVVSVLVPSHVRSPRRVKHLLNSYVMTYRVAAERAASGLLDTWSEDRAIELAKLVCLQVEFPLFARGMIEVPRLPEYVQAAALDRSANWARDFPYIRPRERELAEQFGREQRAVDQSLTRPTDEGASNPDRSDDTPSEVEQAHGLQLLDYLARTASVRGPERDLIYMQTQGAAFGLPGDVADRVIEASQNARLDAVEQELSDENCNAVLDLVVQQVRTSVGVERRNVASVVLDLIRNDRFNLSDRADAIVTSLAPALHEHPDIVNRASIPGLWRLTAASALDESTRLAQIALGSRALHEDPALAAQLFADAERVILIAPGVTGQLLGEHLTGSRSDEFIESMSYVDSEATARLLRSAPDLSSVFIAIWSDADAAQLRIDADAKSASEYAALPAYQRSAAPTVTAKPDDSAVIGKPEDLIAVLSSWATTLSENDDKQGLQGLLRVVLEVDRQEARAFVESYLAVAGPWVTQADNDLLLKRLLQRHINTMSPWLAAVDITRASADVVSNVLAAVGGRLWDTGVGTATISAVGSHLGRLLALCADDQREGIETRILEPINSVVSDDDEAMVRIAALDRASMIIGCDVISSDSVARIEAYNLSQVLAAEYAVQAAGTPYVEYVTSSLTKILDGWGAGEPVMLSSELYDALDTCEWLPQPELAIFRLKAQDRSERPAETPTLDEVMQLMEANSTFAARLGKAWLRARAIGSDPADVVRLLKLLRVYNMWQDEGVCSTLKAVRQEMTGTDQLSLIRELLADRFSLPPSMLDAVGFGELKDEDAVDLLSQRMSDAGNNSERKDILGLAGSRKYNVRSARSRFVTELVIPLFGRGVEATTMALDALARLGLPFPSEARDSVKQALKPAIDSNEKLTRKATEILSPLGFSTKGKGPFGIGGRVLKLD